MANNILNTKSLIEELNQVWQKHVSYLDVASDAYQRLQSSAKLPSNYASALKTQAQNQKDLLKSTEQLRKAEEKAQRQRVQDLKLYAKREKAFDRYERQLLREQKRLERTTGMYNQVQQRINKLSREYNDLATKKALNGKLSLSEAKSLGYLEGQLNKYQSVLKKVDGNIQKYQRNVGNYKSGFDGLGFSIAQLTREAPAFANSMQTGFMAISNNIPMLVDEINKLKIANIELAKSGKPTVNIMRQIGKSLFGWQTLLSAGITLLTVFGPKLVDWATGMNKAKKETAEANKKLEEQNKELRENIRLRKEQSEALKGIFNSSEIAGVKISSTVKEGIDNILKGVTTGVDAEAFLLEIYERFKNTNIEYLDRLKDQEISLKNRAKVANLLIELEDRRSKIDDFRIKQTERISKLEQERIRLGLRGVDTSILDQKIETARAVLSERILFLRRDEVKIQREINKLTAKSTKEIKEQKREIEYLSAIFKSYTGDWKKLNDLLLDTSGIETQVEAFENWEKITRRLRKNTESFLSNFSDDLIKNSPLGNLTMFLDGTFETLLAGADTSAERFAVTFNSIAESAQQAFNFIDSIGQQNFEAQYQRLEQQRNIAIQFAGESTTAREEIERQYEERRREIQKRQAKAQKDLAIFNIGVDTAQAVVATLAQTPPPAGLPLAALVSALGLAKLVAVQSQQIPQFWMGTEGTPGGQIMVNDDPFGKKGANYKEVIQEPSGKLHFPQGKNVKMNVPKGSKVFSNYDNFVKSLDLELMSNNIMPVGQSNIVPMIINQGLTRNEVQSVMSEHGKSIVSAIRNKKEFQWISDEKGTRKYEIENGKRVRIMNSRYSGTGRNV